METEESDVCTQPASSIGCSSNSTKGPQDDATSDTGNIVKPYPRTPHHLTLFLLLL